MDHAHAHIIKANKVADMEIDEMLSDVEPHHESGAHEGEQRKNEERRKNQMKAFAKELAKRLENADEIVIFGPGNAKFELKHELEEHKIIAAKLKGVETTDKMSPAQLKEFMKHYFKLPRD